MRFLRYVLIQGLAYGIDMGGFFLLLTHMAMAPLTANIISKVLAGVFAFFAHRSFTFEVAHEGGKMQQAVKYFVLLGLNIPLSSATLALVLWVIPYPVAAKFIADVIGIFITYWLSKRFVFLAGHEEVKLANGRGEQ